MSALRDLHAAFWDRPPEVAATLRSRLGLWWPETLASERDGADQQPKAAERGWFTLEARAGRETATLARRVVEQSEAIVEQLQSAGTTLLHGDASPNNAARQRNRTVLVDWALACAGPPEVEMAWLANFEHLFDFPAQVVVEEALAGGARGRVLRLALGALAAGIVPAACSGLDYPDPAHRAVIAKKVEWWSHALVEAADLLP
jgi:aminoglycoside phosphotransferase (APT) family kinase protein